MLGEADVVGITAFAGDTFKVPHSVEVSVMRRLDHAAGITVAPSS